MNVGTIAEVFAEKAMPDEEIAKVISHNRSAGGVCIIDTSGDEPEVLVSRGDSGATVDQVKNVLKKFEDSRRILFFGDNTTNSYAEQDRQPFELIKEGEKIILAGLAEGNFPKFQNKANVHSTEYHMMVETLKPKFEQLWKLVKGDLDALMGYLREEVTMKEMTAHIEGRGCIYLIGGNGDTVVYETNPTKSEFDWGWVSKKFDKALVPSTADKLKAAASAVAGKARRSVSFGSEPEPEVQPVIPADMDPKVLEGDKTDTKLPKTLQTGEKELPTGDLVKPPAAYFGKKLKKWYNRMAGYLPPKYEEERPAVLIKFPHRITEFADLRMRPLASTEPVNSKGKETSKTVQDAASPMKDTTTKNIPEGKGPIQHGHAVPGDAMIKPAINESNLMIPEKEKQFLVKTFANDKRVAKIIDHAGDLILNPKALLEIEEKWPSFADVSNIPLDETLNLPIEVFEYLLKEAPKSAAVLWRNTATALMFARQNEQGAFNADLTGRGGESTKKKGEPEAQREEPKQVASGGGRRRVAF